MYKRILFKNFSWQTLNEILSAVMGFIFFAIMTRTLGPAGVGTYSYLFSFMGLILMALDAGLPATYLRRWSVNTRELQQDMHDISSVKILALSIISIGMVVFARVFEQELMIELLLAYIYVALDSLTRIPLIYTNSQNRFDQAFFISMSERFVSLGVGVILLLLGFGLLPVLVAFVIGRIVSLTVSLALTKLTFHPTVSIKTVVRLLQASLPLLFVAFVTNIYFRIDMVMIRFFLDFSELGLYGSAYKILDTLIVIPYIIVTIISPVIVKLYADKDSVKLSKLFHSILVYSSIISLFIAIFFTFYSAEILDFLFGAEFIAGRQVLVLLAWSSVLLFLNIPFARFLVASFQEKYLIKSLLLVAVFNIALNALLLPRVGILGAAISTLLSEIALLTCVFVKLQPTVSHVRYHSVIIKLAVATGLVGGFLSLKLIPLFPALFITGPAFLLILFALKVVEISQLEELLGKKFTVLKR